MTLERISAFITYCIAVVLAWLGDLSIKDASTLDQATPRTNGDLNALLDETEAAWAVCADKVDMIIACQERNSEQTTIPAPRTQ
ncbi:Rz1-like lysis system protein LysC [Escherichia coli O9,9a:H30]